MNSCPVCNCIIKRKPSFWKRIKGLATCSKKCRGLYLKEIYLGSNNPNSKYKTTYDAFFNRKIKNINHSANQRGIPFSLTSNCLKELYEQQNGLCYYTSIPMQLNTTSNWEVTGQAYFDILSVDRIDSSKGYEKNNIVLCCTGINKAKGNMSKDEFQEFINYIVLKQTYNSDIKIKLLRNNATLPMKMGMGNAGYDISACKIEDLGNAIKVYTGISAEPPVGTYLEFFPRSSISKKGMVLANSVGIIDNSYRGEIIAIFYKMNNYTPFEIGERIGQIVPRRYVSCKFIEVDELSDTDRGSGAFGSTGK